MSDIPPGPAPHKPADDEEEVYFEGSPMLRSLLGIMILCSVLAIGIIAGAAVGVYYKIYWGLIAVPVALLLFLIPRYITRSTRYRISNYRIDFERGLLSKNIDTLELWHVEDISFHQSFFDRILRVGNIIVISNDDTNPKLVLEGLPNPRALFEQLKQRVIAVKRQRGVIKMDAS